jgi:aspartate racemase
MEDGFFAKTLNSFGIEVTIPTLTQRDNLQNIHEELMQGQATQSSKDYFQNLVKQYKNLNAVVLGCTEYPLVLNQTNSILPLVNPAHLQALAAVDFALSDN